MLDSHVASVALMHCLHALQVALTVHVAMTAYQSVIYDWVKATGTLRLSPYDHRIGKSHRHNFAPLNNKCMELRKVPAHVYTILQPSAYILLHQTCTGHAAHFTQRIVQVCRSQQLMKIGMDT